MSLVPFGRSVGVPPECLERWALEYGRAIEPPPEPVGGMLAGIETRLSAAELKRFYDLHDKLYRIQGRRNAALRFVRRITRRIDRFLFWLFPWSRSEEDELDVLNRKAGLVE